jgi:hypothetical protein
MGGLGKPILDRLKRQGWSNIRYIDNRTASSRPKTYKNRGAELYFNVRILFERGELIILNEPVLVRQLSTRYYKLMDGSIHQLLSKVESRSRGYPSPDRADSFVLAFWDYKSTFVEGGDKPYELPEIPIEEINKELIGDFDQKSWAYGKDRHAYVAENHNYEFSEIQEELAEINKQRVLTR